MPGPYLRLSLPSLVYGPAPIHDFVLPCWLAVLWRRLITGFPQVQATFQDFDLNSVVPPNLFDPSLQTEAPLPSRSLRSRYSAHAFSGPVLTMVIGFCAAFLCAI